MNDETDGHIDNLACFVRPGEVCLTWTDDRRDPQWRASSDALERLAGPGRAWSAPKGAQAAAAGPAEDDAAEAAGVLNRAGAKPRVAGERLAASYVEFLYRERRCHHAAAGSCGRMLSAANTARRVSRPTGGGRARQGNSAGRRQYPLHHSADTVLYKCGELLLGLLEPFPAYGGSGRRKLRMVQQLAQHLARRLALLLLRSSSA